MDTSLTKCQFPELVTVENKIESVENKSDEMTSRMRIRFKNGYGISIIRGQFTYGGAEGLFEIGPLNKDGELDGSVLDYEYDDVEGHLTVEDVKDRMIQISEL